MLNLFQESLNKISKTSRMSCCSIRFLTYNVHSCVGTDGVYDVSRVAATAAAGKPDIIALQEIENNATSACKVNGDDNAMDGRARCRIWSVVHSDDQPGQIAHVCELPYVSFVPTLEASVVEGEKSEILVGNDEERIIETNTSDEDTKANASQRNQQKCRYGNAIASRFPILRTEVLHYRPPLKPGERINMGSEEQPRLAMACLLDVGEEGITSSEERESRTTMSRPVWVVNTHLSHKAYHAEQHRQAKQCAEWVATDLQTIARESHQQDYGTPVLLAGDLNSPIELLGGWVSFGGYSTLANHAGFIDLRFLPADKKANDPNCPTRPPSYHEPTSKQWKLPSSNPKQLLPSARIDHVLAYIPPCGEEGSETESNKKGDNGRVSVNCESVRVLKDERIWRVASDHCAVVAAVVLNWVK